MHCSGASEAAAAPPPYCSLASTLRISEHVVRRLHHGRSTRAIHFAPALPPTHPRVRVAPVFGPTREKNSHRPHFCPVTVEWQDTVHQLVDIRASGVNCALATLLQRVHRLPEP